MADRDPGLNSSNKISQLLTSVAVTTSPRLCWSMTSTSALDVGVSIDGSTVGIISSAQSERHKSENNTVWDYILTKKANSWCHSWQNLCNKLF